MFLEQELVRQHDDNGFDLEGTNCIASRNRCAGMIMRTPIGEEREVYLVLELVR